MSMAEESFFRKWANSCIESGEELWALAGSGETGFYGTRKKYEYRNNFYYTSTVYHVWDRGKHVLCTLSYNEASSKWEAVRLKQSNRRLEKWKEQSGT